MTTAVVAGTKRAVNTRARAKTKNILTTRAVVAAAMVNAAALGSPRWKTAGKKQKS
jgi:hypothetical protein